MSQSQLTKFDQSLVDAAYMIVQPSSGSNYTIRFQFPPRVTSESNSMQWDDKDKLLANGPVSIQRGGSGRKVEVEWEYIATDNKFTPQAIATELRHLKSYHFEFEFPGQHMPVVMFKYTEVVPDGIKFRMMNVNISYGPEIVGQGGSFFPLYTKVSVSLEMATQLGSLKPSRPPIQTFAKNLPTAPKPEWY